MSVNELIINQFKLLIKQIKYDIDYSSGKNQIINMYRLRSIQQVLKILEKFPENITSSTQLIGIKNIGKNSLARIDEILRTGKLSEVKITEDTDKYLKIIAELEDVFGIGRKKAYELFKNYNIKSVEELKKKYEEGLIDLSENIVKGLNYVGKIKEQIPREEIDELDMILQHATLELDPQLFCEICGSYRREKPTSNDVDIILLHTKLIKKKDILKKNYLKLFINKLKEKHIIIDSLTSEDVPTKYMGIYNLDNKILRRIDIRYIPYESYYSAILYFTGSSEFNRKMRQIAIDMGYILNEYGLFDENGKVIKINSEKEIFDKLNIEYLTPDKRN
jgi:DNA polymerase/3'-5' exonuclease PolX